MLVEEHKPSDAHQQRFRLDAHVHDSLMHDPKPAKPLQRNESLALPEPVFPQRPELCGDVAPNPKCLPSNGKPYRTHVTPFIVRRALRGWLYTYIRSRITPGDFHPIIAYLFTE
jgi:hypothetical protein